MKSFETVGQVVTNAILVHERAQKFFAQIAEGEASPRAALFASHLATREEHLAKRLRSHEEDSTPAERETWLQFTAETSANDLFSEPVSDQPSLDELAAFAEKIQVYLTALFREIAEEVGAPKISETLENLASLEEQEEKSISLCRSQVEQM